MKVNLYNIWKQLAQMLRHHEQSKPIKNATKRWNYTFMIILNDWLKYYVITKNWNLFQKQICMKRRI